MKKLFISILFILSASAVVDAQEKKNDISVMYGLGSLHYLCENEGGIPLYTHIKTGALSVQYIRRINRILGYGGIMVFEKIGKDEFYPGTRGGDNYGVSASRTDCVFSLMPVLRSNWVHTKYFNLYNKIGLGAAFVSEKYKADDKSLNLPDKRESVFEPAYQFTLLGLDFGSERIHAAVELGFGSQGLGVLGVKYKF